VHLKHGYSMLIHFIHWYYCIYRPWQPLTYLYFLYCISLIYFSFTKICMFLYAQIYWLAEFGDVSCLQFNYLRVDSHSHSDLGRFCRTILRVTISSSPTKLCVRPESMIVDPLGGICMSLHLINLLKEQSQCFAFLDGKIYHLVWISQSKITS
jgi:hypothetical protein